MFREPVSGARRIYRANPEINQDIMFA